MKLILLMDDDQGVIGNLQNTLEREKFTVISCNQGTEEQWMQMLMLISRQNGSRTERELVYEEICMDLWSREVTVGGHPIKLTKTEYALLKLFLQNPCQVLPKDVVLERISADTPDCVENSLKVHISNLRKKLKRFSGRDYIENVWGVGFKLVEPPEQCNSAAG